MAKKTIKFLNENNFYVFIVTNQSGIARGYYSEDDVINLHNFINNELKKINAHVDEFFYSPYHPDYENKLYYHLKHLRKPNIGMLELAEQKWDIDKSKSFLIGDKITDMQCAEKFKIKGHLFDGRDLFKFIKSLNLKINH